MVSPRITISRFMSPISPTTSGPACSAAAQPRLGAESAVVVAAPQGERVGDGEQAGDAGAVAGAARERPGDDDLVPDIAVDLAAGLDHGIGDVEEDAVEEAMEVCVAEPFGDRGRIVEIEETARSLRLRRAADDSGR